MNPIVNYGLPVRMANSLLTLYMLLILVRWMAPRLALNLLDARLRWIPRLTDPLIDAMRRLLPPMGPVDFGPLAALFVVFVIRALVC